MKFRGQRRGSAAQSGRWGLSDGESQPALEGYGSPRVAVPTGAVRPAEVRPNDLGRRAGYRNDRNHDGASLRTYQYLVGHGVTAAALQHGIELATRCDVPLARALSAGGWMSAQAYVTCTASQLQLPLITRAHLGSLRPLSFAPGFAASLLERVPEHLHRHCMVYRFGDRQALVIDGAAVSLSELMQLADAHPSLAVTDPETLREALLRHYRAEYAARAVGDLRERFADQSAASGLTRWQIAVMSMLFLGGVLGAVTVPAATAIVALVGLAATFFCVVLLRLAALIFALVSRGHSAPSVRRVADRLLPVYTLLVPLYREANVVPDLVQALMALDYPSAKLDIKLIVEEIDAETREAIERLRLPACFDLVIVPDGSPRTKPRALNYALHFAEGSYCVIYDAEDRPEADQLRRALQAFREGAPYLACCQARLNIYNRGRNWFTRQFTVEYSVLFDAMLPALRALRLPVPLGGTSNHFKTPILKRVGGWDAHNVTEDADLGIRLMRHGYAINMLASTTHEEAPVRFRHWLPQRTRWLKGWIQTWFVHTRSHRQLLRDLGVWRTFGFHLLFVGQVVSSLVHPWFYLGLAYLLVSQADPRVFLMPAQDALHAMFQTLCLGNLVAGYLGAIGLGVVAVLKRGYLRLLLSPLLLPIYWLLISMAAYRAVWQVIWKPYFWEKTPHGVD